MAALVLSAVGLLATDLTLTQTTTSHSHEVEQTQLWSSRFMRINQPEDHMDLLVDFAQGVSYTVDHEKKVIQKITWDDLELATEAFGKKLRGLPPLVQQVMGINNASVSVEDRGSEPLLGHECRRWRITLGPMMIETSNDPSISLPVPALPYQRFLKLQALIGQRPSDPVLALRIGEALAKVQGLALKYRIVLPIVGQTTTITTRLEDGPIPPSAFELPSDYQVEDAGKKMLENLGQ
ncbi:MAG TPA: hypothetical protein VF768_05945 [Holophagaceae bacterium]